MPDLPKISEDFTANPDGYIAAIQLMIDRTKELITEVTALKTLIGELDGKTLDINIGGDWEEVLGTIKSEIESLDGSTIRVNVVYTSNRPDIDKITEQVTVSAPAGGKTTETIAEQATGAQQAADAINEVTNATEKQSEATDVNIDKLKEQAAEFNEVANAATSTKEEISLVAAANEALAGAIGDDDVTFARLRSTLNSTVEVIKTARTTMGELSDTSTVAAGADALLARAMNDVNVSADAQRSAINAVNAAKREMAAQSKAVAQATAQEEQSFKDLEASLSGTGNSFDQLSARAQFLRDSISQNVAYTNLLAGAAQALALKDVEVTNAVRILSQALDDNGGSSQVFVKAMAEGKPTLLAFALAAKDAGDNVGGMLIPMSAASFGITGLGTAIHLIVMGTFEFLAVFIPAMYAAAAGAAVMMQGVDNVTTHVTGLYTAAEALGPMFNTTAGDMVGLGHSLQTAQNEANPGVYELLGEAITGIRDATGPTTNGLSEFGQMGLDVEHILDTFGAKLDIDIVQNMGKIHSVLSNAIQDLTEFGQIFGNLGHALVNFAAAMPGAAEIALKVIDMFSQLVKWASSLPAPLITVIFVFEELYRWSGLIAGGFALLGRAIALVGTLGIPVLIKIGSNVGAMVASVLSGLAAMVTNFTAMGTKIGLFGDGVDKVATGIVGGLTKAAEFMTGPWGIAISLAAIGITALAIAFSRGANSTEAWVIASQKAVSAANNLQVLNVIAQQMQVTTQKLATSNNELATAQNNLVNSSKQTDALSSLAHAETAVQNAINDQNNATKSQQELMGETSNVLGGASTIANQFGISFTEALGYADLAGVKLSTTTVKFGKDMNEAGLQIASLVSGYETMDQVGNTLANSMAAVNVQAGLQATDVSKVNSAWDSFISNATGLTGGLSQLNLDLQQMGNQAATTGTKISAFTGTTTLSVGQIAQSLTSFSGASAQTWQAFNQSVSQANTYMDALRTAAASGVVAQGQFQKAGSDVVAMLLPYASQSKTATAEVSALAQEVGGPATSNFQTLSSWVKQTGGSAQDLTGLTNTLTQKMTNLTQVAQNFAGTLQQDVINAIAQAGVSTSDITGLTQKYTQSLQENGANNKTTQQDQDNLTNALKSYGFSATAITQIEDQLTAEFGKNTSTINSGDGARKTLQSDIQNLMNTVPGAQQDIVKLTQAVQQHGATASSYHDARIQLINDLISAGVNANTAKNDVNNLITALRNVPSNVQATVTVSGHGGEYITSSVGPSGQVNVYPVKAAAAGGVMPGYDPGHDSIHALLSPGEGILIPQAVKMLGGAAGIAALNKNAQHFAWGGVTGLPNQLQSTAGAAFAAADAKILSQVLAKIGAEVQTKLNAEGTSIPVHGLSLSLVPYFMQAMALTGVPSSWLGDLETIAEYESGLNPNAINLTDSNAAAGDPSRGLMQTIMTTFEAYHQAGTSNDIYDPTANIAAAINYIKARYGSVFNVPGIISLSHGGGYVGYDSGGLLMPGLTMAYNGTGQPEIISPPGAGGQVVHTTINIDGKKVAEAISPALYQKAARQNGNANASGYWAPGNYGPRKGN